MYLGVFLVVLVSIHMEGVELRRAWPEYNNPIDIHTAPIDIKPTTVGKVCKSSRECATGSSCRDNRGNILYIPENAWGPVDIGINGRTGTCGEGAKLAEVCVVTQECPTDHECYREVSGMCCPPKRCVTKEYAEKRRHYWANCHPPNCYFPAK